MNNGNKLPEVLDLLETAAFLRLEESAVRDLAASGQLPGRFVLNQWRFSKTNLQEWLRGEAYARESLTPFMTDGEVKDAWDEVRKIIRGYRKKDKARRARARG